MNRRSWVLVGAGAAAGAAGLVWQLRRGAPSNTTAVTPATAPAGTAPPLEPAAAAFWQSSFARPDGQTLTMATLRGAPLVLNFWGTWCPPCVKEMPELDRFAKQFAARGGRVVGLAVDNPTAVRAFLAHAPVSYTICLAGFDGTDLSRQLGNTSGALPFTAVFNRSGNVAQRKLGETSFDELSRWVQDL
jgi:thiol-disulfide isomerase/thioredoxin